MPVPPQFLPRRALGSARWEQRAAALCCVESRLNISRNFGCPRDGTSVQNSVETSEARADDKKTKKPTAPFGPVCVRRLVCEESVRHITTRAKSSSLPGSFGDAKYAETIGWRTKVGWDGPKTRVVSPPPANKPNAEQTDVILVTLPSQGRTRRSPNVNSLPRRRPNNPA